MLARVTIVSFLPIESNHLLNTKMILNAPGKLQMNFTSRKSNTPCIKELIVNSVSINKSTDLANVLNEHFGTVGLKS